MRLYNKEAHLSFGEGGGGEGKNQPTESVIQSAQLEVLWVMLRRRRKNKRRNRRKNRRRRRIKKRRRRKMIGRAHV